MPCLADIETGGAKDALPLLSFTLERLYVEHGGDGDLKLAEYREIGGIGGSIEAAVSHAFEAADSDPAVPKDISARLTLIRRAFIPWLAGIDPESGSPRRAIARLSEIPEESRPIIEHLIDQRLLATDLSDTGQRTIEPAHEAILRQWGLLRGWIQEDIAQLSILEGVKRATRDWLSNARSPDWLAHSLSRLKDAEDLTTRPDLAPKLDVFDREYLSACRAAETQRNDKEHLEANKLKQAQKAVASRTRLGLAAASLLAAVVVGLFLLGAFWWDQHVRTKTSYCSAYGERWGEPFCMGLMDETNRRNRVQVFRLISRGGHVVKVTRVNNLDTPIGDPETFYEVEDWSQGAADYSYDYDQGGRVSVVKQYNRMGILIRQLRWSFSADKNIAIVHFEKDLGVSDLQRGAGSFLGSWSNDLGRSNIGQHRVSFSPRGFLLERQFEQTGGEKISDRTGAFGRAYDYSPNGFVTQVRNLDADGKTLMQRDGIALLRRTDDGSGNLLRVSWHDASGAPALNESIIATVAFERDTSGNLIRQSYFGMDGRNAIRKDTGIARIELGPRSKWQCGGRAVLRPHRPYGPCKGYRSFADLLELRPARKCDF